MENIFNDVSLLWPDGIIHKNTKSQYTIPDYSYTDIGLDSIARIMAVNEKYTGSIKAILSDMNTTNEIIDYRLDILDDFIKLHNLENNITGLLQKISGLEDCNRIESTGGLVFKAVSRVKELDIYSECLRHFKAFFSKYGSAFKSCGLCKLRDLILYLAEVDDFETISEMLPNLEKRSTRPVSVTIGVNLDAFLRPIEATIISINDKKYNSASFFNKLFANTNSNENFKGISELRTEYAKNKRLKFNEFLEKENLPMPQIDSTSLQMILINDLSRILNSSLESVVSVVERYNNIKSNFLIRIKTELAFYLGAVRLVNIIRNSGLPMSRPVAAPREERIFTLEGLYNLHLAFKLYRKKPGSDISPHIIGNNLKIDDNGRIYVLTGPNSGGKTTYIQAVALIQALFQAGIYVPAVRARISPVDNIYTHFPVEEKTGIDTGRLGEESKRLNDIFRRASRYSMIILNESFSSTSPGESLYMSRDIVFALRHLGARGVFATHLHELGMDVEGINTAVSGDSIVSSLVAGVAPLSDVNSTEPAKRTYKIVPGKPQGISYAKDIARHFGISFEQLEKIIDENRQMQNT